MHSVERSDGKGTRPATLRDARKLGLLPSPTSILRVLHKQGLVDWLIEQACLSVLTAPKLPKETLDAFVERVLHTERQQDAQAAKARDLGTAIHDAIEKVLTGKECPKDLAAYVTPAIESMKQFGVVRGTEQVVVGERCAGRMDAWFQIEETGKQTVVDVKTATNPPTKGSWPEHKLQLSFYAKALPLAVSDQTANVYISTKEPGIVAVDVHSEWADTYQRGFKPLIDYWVFANNYDPANP